MPVSKTEGGKSYPASSYLVVGDPQSPSTWALRVKDENGKPDHRVMGAAWAALHNGYRGNKYEGPDKGKAIAALKKIYDAEEMVTPSEETSKEGDDSMTVNLQEHATLKARALGLSKALKELLDEKTLPRVIRRQMENLRTSLKKTWKDLENEAGWDKETAQEDGGDPIPVRAFEGVSSFADLKAARIATEYVSDIQSLACDFSLLVSNALENDEIPNKAEAILALAEEFVSELAALQPATEGEGEGMMTEGEADATDAGEPLAETAAQAEVEPEPQAEPVIEAQEQPAQIEILVENEAPVMPVTIAEHATILEASSISTDADRRDPIKIKVAFIQEGWGNARDGHYYPADTLAASAPLFRNAKMYLTDHVQAEKNVRTEAAFIESVDGFIPGVGLVGNVVVYDPDFAEKTRNLANPKVNRLDLMECSIYAEGETQAARIGERAGKVVKQITKVGSVDFVSSAGAGGHAMHLTEVAAPNTTEGKIMDKEKVVELLAQTRLPKPLQAVLAEREYVDEKAVTDSVAAFIESWKAETGGGEPFAQGNAQPPQRGRTLEEHAAAVNDLYKRAGILS